MNMSCEKLITQVLSDMMTYLCEADKSRHVDKCYIKVLLGRCSYYNNEG